MEKNKCTGIIPVLLLFCLAVQGQAVGSWKSYLAYQDATQAAETPNYVFGVYDGSLVSYSLEDQSVQTYSLENGLHDMNIRFLIYSPEAKALMIIYDNSNMDIFTGKNTIYNMPDIKGYANFSNKIVNNVEVRGEQVYLATGYGISVVDLKRREVKNTYDLKVNTTAVCHWGEFIYAATSDGLRRAALSSNLVDIGNWELVSLSNGNAKNITHMAAYNDHLVFGDNQSVWRLAPDGAVQRLVSGACKQLAVFNGQLQIAVQEGIFFYTDWDKSSFLRLTQEYRSIAPSESTGSYWIAWGAQGVVKLKVKEQEGSNELDYETVIPGIKVNSPLRNRTYHLTFQSDKLLVTGGGRAGDRYNWAGTFMRYDKGKWYNLDEEALIPLIHFECKDLMSAIVDPRDPNHYYVSSWGEGVYEFKDTAFVKLHTYDNSSLSTISSPESPNKPHYVRTDGMVYDKNNNLYITNGGVAGIISVLTHDGKWYPYVYEKIGVCYPGQIIITRDNKKWLNIFRGTRLGIAVVDDKDTREKEDDVEYYSREFTDQENRTIGATTYSCLAEDLNGSVWVGTDKGPIVFSSAEQMDRGECTRPTITDQYGAGHYLMEGTRVTAIAIDGANRKWIGTSGEGVFVVDQSDGVQVENFNMTNSDIISNNINSIAINGKTGEVFIATDRGICSYRSDAIEGKPDYSEARAFPNPVRPASSNQVVITGLMQNSRVKITDLAGNLMKEATSVGGQYTWNCSNPKGDIVKAGIYLVFATLPDGSQGVVTKIMVIK
jgi:hypothetical protein